MSLPTFRSWAAVCRCTVAFALLSMPAVRLGAADDRDALLNRALKAAEEKLRNCGPALHARFALEGGNLRAITYAVGPGIRACRDTNTVALGKVGEPLIVLCTPQFWRKVEQDEEEAAHFLIHEYLHTRGLNEWPQGGRYDSVSITRIVKEACSGHAPPVPSSTNVRIDNEHAAAAVRRAVAAASERLKAPACQALLQRFRDVEGRTLEQNLEATGQSTQSYLATNVLFYEGYQLPTCRSRRAKKGIAVTRPGSRAVFVCTSRFTELAQRSPAEAEAIVIHEMLHTLGLGENPPSSDEITDAVIEACVS